MTDAATRPGTNAAAAINADCAERLAASLGLDSPPIAIAFADAPPPGVATSDQVVPSACAFWRAAEERVFFAPAARHFNCPVGAHVMGFALPETVSAELMGLIGTMTECGYIAAGEPAHIPVNKRGAQGVLYGRLADFPAVPDAVLMWLNPAQAMLWSEAEGAAEWGGATPAIFTGRPACAAIPTALGNGASALSLGCAGMRTFTQVGPDKLLAVLAGPHLAKATAAIAGMRGVNDGMEGFYQGRAAALAG